MRRWWLCRTSASASGTLFSAQLFVSPINLGKIVIGLSTFFCGTGIANHVGMVFQCGPSCTLA